MLWLTNGRSRLDPPRLPGQTGRQDSLAFVCANPYHPAAMFAPISRSLPFLPRITVLVVAVFLSLANGSTDRPECSPPAQDE